jgi:hypothetical protein
MPYKQIIRLNHQPQADANIHISQEHRCFISVRESLWGLLFSHVWPEELPHYGVWQPSEASDVEEIEKPLAVERQLEVEVDHEAEGHNLVDNMPGKGRSLEQEYYDD